MIGGNVEQAAPGPERPGRRRAHVLVAHRRRGKPWLLLKPGENTAHVAFGDAQSTGDRASGLARVGGASGDDLALGRPLYSGRAAQPDALGAGTLETGVDPLLDG